MSDKPKVAWMTGPGAGSWWLYKNWCLGCHCSRFKKWLIKLSQVDKIFQSSNLINFIRQSLFSNIFLDVISWHSAMYYTNSLYTIEMGEKYWCVLSAVVFGSGHLQLQSPPPNGFNFKFWSQLSFLTFLLSINPELSHRNGTIAPP